MPYISQKRRAWLEDHNPEEVGDLNYIFTKIILSYLANHPPKYQTINDIMGALESCKQEFYRRVAVKYEEYKRNEHGDVYEV